MASECAVSKTELLSTLDRVSVFTAKLRVNAVTLTFTENGLMISSTDGNASETIPYLENVSYSSFSANILVDKFRSFISARNGDVVHMLYGNPKFIKFVDGNISQLAAYTII